MRPRLPKDRVDFFEHLRRLSFHIERFVVCDRAGQKYQITEDCGAAIPFTRIDSFDIHDPFFPFLFWLTVRATAGRPTTFFGIVSQALWLYRRSSFMPLHVLLIRVTGAQDDDFIKGFGDEL